jgi:hypothetical protein
MSHNIAVTEEKDLLLLKDYYFSPDLALNLWCLIVRMTIQTIIEYLAKLKLIPKVASKKVKVIKTLYISSSFLACYKKIFRKKI